jgi:MFS family permease
VVVAFALGLAGAGLAAGRLSDLIGLKRLGVVTFAAEVLLFAGMVFAPALWMLYPLRFLQGIARAGSTNAAAAMLIGSYSPENRGRVLGMRYSLVYGGQILGVLYAGQVVDAWGWRAAVGGVMALSLVHTLALVLLARPDTGDREPETHEGKIVRIVDRIAYVNHDIDDALRYGLLTQRDLPAPEIGLLGDTGSHPGRAPPDL